MVRPSGLYSEFSNITYQFIKDTETVLPTTQPPVNRTLPWKFHNHIREEKSDKDTVKPKSGVKKKIQISHTSAIVPCEDNSSNNKRSISRVI